MAIDTSVWASDLGFMIADLPGYADWQGRVFTCSITELNREETMLLVGDVQSLGITITFLVSAISGLTAPKPQDRITIRRGSTGNFQPYEVVTSMQSADHVAWSLVLNRDNRN